MSDDVPQQPAGSWQFKPDDSATAIAVSPAEISVSLHDKDASTTQVPEPAMPAQVVSPNPEPTPLSEPAPVLPAATIPSGQSSISDQQSFTADTTPAPTLLTETYLAPLPQAPVAPSGAVTWTASEFIAHHKSVGWYGVLALGTAVLTLLIYFLTKDIVSSVVVVVAAIVFGIYAARKPRTLTYRLDSHGLTIAQKLYDYSQFRSFAVLQEDAFSSIVFVPLKRFMPYLTVYYDPKDEQKIVGTLAANLPVDTHKLDMVEQFLRRIRF